MTRGLRYRRPWSGLVVLAVVAFAAVATSASGSAAVRDLTHGTPPGGPDLSTMAFRLADFPAGAQVLSQGYIRSDKGTIAEYDRQFKDLSVRLGSKRCSRSRTT